MTCILLRVRRNMEALNQLYICRFDESNTFVTSAEQNLLKPLQEEIEEKRFKEQLLLESSNIISYHNNGDLDNSDCTFSNSDLESITQQSVLFKNPNQIKNKSSLSISGKRRFTDFRRKNTK